MGVIVKITNTMMRVSEIAMVATMAAAATAQGVLALSIIAAAATSANAETYDRDDRPNKETNRFWESEPLPGQPQYSIVLDRATGCKYLAVRNRLTALIDKDRLPDCSGMRLDNLGEEAE